MALRSRLFRGDPKLEAAAVSPHGHIVPGAVGEHVAKIQHALIRLDGATVALDEQVTRSYGPSTAGAVLRYKQKRDIINRSYQTQADNIVGVMTMASLDKEMSEREGTAKRVPLLAQTSNGTCVRIRPSNPKTPPTPSPVLPNPYVVQSMTPLIPTVRLAIQAAEFRLMVADRHVTNHKQTLPTGPFNEAARESLLLLDTVFDFLKFDNPRPAFDNFRMVYRNMIVALNRSSPTIAPTLFVGNVFNEMEQTSSAYTGHGGAFVGPDEVLEGLDVPANRIYLCSNLANAPYPEGWLMSTIHELAHFVSASEVSIGDSHLNGSFFLPRTAANFRARNPTFNPCLKHINQNQKIRTADCYAAFAFLAARTKLGLVL
jgi:hypothetical protein